MARRKLLYRNTLSLQGSKNESLFQEKKLYKAIRRCTLEELSITILVWGGSSWGSGCWWKKELAADAGNHLLGQTSPMCFQASAVLRQPAVDVCSRRWPFTSTLEQAFNFTVKRKSANCQQGHLKVLMQMVREIWIARVKKKKKKTHMTFNLACSNTSSGLYSAYNS